MSDDKQQILKALGLTDAEIQEREAIGRALEESRKLAIVDANARAQGQRQGIELGWHAAQAERSRPTANEIIANYYRELGLYPKLKLAKYLRRIGESRREGYIRKAKVEYDKRHKKGKIP